MIDGEEIMKMNKSRGNIFKTNSWIRLITVTLIMVLSFSGCSKYIVKEKEVNINAKNDKLEDNNQKDNNLSKDKTLIRIGMMSSSDVIPYVLMNEKEFLDSYNIDLQLEVFTSAKDRDAAFTAGELDGVLTDYIGICMYQNAGFDVRITGITDGDYILVAGKDTGITDISQIIGKSIAISENTLIDYTLDNILANNNLASDDVIKEIIPRIPDRLELLRNDKIDLGLLPEPFVTLALNDGAIYLGSANEFGLYPAVSAFSKAAIDKKSEAIHDLYKAYNEAIEYMNETELAEYEETAITAVGYPKEMIGKITINEFRISTLPPKAEIEAAIEWASNKGLCSKDLAYEDLIFDVYSE